MIKPKEGQLWDKYLEGGGCCSAIIIHSPLLHEVAYVYLCSGHGSGIHRLSLERFLLLWKYDRCLGDASQD